MWRGYEDLSDGPSYHKQQWIDFKNQWEWCGECDTEHHPYDSCSKVTHNIDDAINAFLSRDILLETLDREIFFEEARAQYESLVRSESLRERQLAVVLKKKFNLPDCQ